MEPLEEPLEDSVDQEVEDLESIWPGAASAVEPDQPDQSVVDRLLAKRSAVIQDLQGKSVLIESDDEADAQPDPKKIKMDPGEWGLPASATSGASDPGPQAVLPMVEAPNPVQPAPWIIWILHSFHFGFFGNTKASMYMFRYLLITKRQLGMLLLPHQQRMHLCQTRLPLDIPKVADWF